MKALVSGTLAAAAVSLVASIASRRATGAYATALNSTSHFAWGDRAARRHAVSVKYTALGAAANYGACVFWALFYEALGGGKRRRQLHALRDGALVSALAYVVDYHVVPRRLTPGFELRLPGRALAGIYGALAIGLALRDVFRAGWPWGRQRTHPSSRRGAGRSTGR
jgi:hypothetical protein